MCVGVGGRLRTIVVDPPSRRLLEDVSTLFLISVVTVYTLYKCSLYGS